MNKQEAYKILTNPETVIVDYSNNTVNKKWKEAYDIAVNNLQQSKKLTQINKTYKGMLNKQNRIIQEMSSYIAGLDIEEDICSKTGKRECDKMAYGECEQCIREYFEKISK